MGVRLLAFFPSLLLIERSHNDFHGLSIACLQEKRLKRALHFGVGLLLCRQGREGRATDREGLLRGRKAGEGGDFARVQGLLA